MPDASRASDGTNAHDVLPRLVAVDMDGTFLATDKGLPAPNLRLLDVLHAQGSELVPCTGRPVKAIPYELMMHPATRHAIGANGAVVYDVASRTPIHVEAIRKDLVLALYDRVRHLHVTFDVFADGEVFSERARYDAMGSYGIDKPSLEVLRRVRVPVDMPVPAIVADVSLVEKVTCFWWHEEDRNQLGAAIEEVGGFSSAHGHPKNFELQAQGVSKGSALSWLCDHLGVRRSETVAFGDEANDVSLLIAAGIGVAMANATDDVRAVADRVTTSNDDAGVARYFGL